MKRIIYSLMFLIGSAALSLYADVKISGSCQVNMSNNVIVDTKGNWQNNSAAFTQNSGKIIFSGLRTVNDTLQHNGTLKKVAFKKSGTSGFYLKSDINISDSLIMVSGKVYTNAFNVNLGTAGAVKGEASGTCVSGKLTVTRNIGTASSYFGGIGLMIGSGSTNIGTISVLRTTGDEAQTDISGYKSIKRKWQLSGASANQDRSITYNWLPDEVTTGTAGMTIWKSGNNTAWERASNMSSGGPNSVNITTNPSGFFTASSESPINLPPAIVMLEDGLKVINIQSGLKGTGRYTGYLADCTIYFSDGKKSTEIQKGISGRAYTLSVTGNTNIAVSLNGMIATFTPAANWNGGEDIKFILTENSTKADNLNKSVLKIKNQLSLAAGRVQESFFDIVNVSVNPVNDAPVITSFFPTVSSFPTTLQNLKFSVNVNDVDNPFTALSFKWFVKKGNDNEVEQTDYDSVFTANFSAAAIYKIRGQVSDGLLQVSNTWTVDANPSSIGDNLLPEVTELKQNYPNPFNPQTTINYSLKDAAAVSINVYNHAGQLVKSLVNGIQQSGFYSAVWNAADISSGIYFYQMKAGDYQMIKRAVVIK